MVHTSGAWQFSIFCSDRPHWCRDGRSIGCRHHSTSNRLGGSSHRRCRSSHVAHSWCHRHRLRRNGWHVPSNSCCCCWCAHATWCRTADGSTCRDRNMWCRSHRLGHRRDTWTCREYWRPLRVQCSAESTAVAVLAAALAPKSDGARRCCSVRSTSWTTRSVAVCRRDGCCCWC